MGQAIHDPPGKMFQMPPRNVPPGVPARVSEVMILHPKPFLLLWSLCLLARSRGPICTSVAHHTSWPPPASSAAQVLISFQRLEPSPCN